MLSALLARTPDSLLWNLSPSRLINEATITILAEIPGTVLELALWLLTAREIGSSKCHHPHHLQLNIFIWEKRHQVTSYSRREIWAQCLTWNALKKSAFKSRRFINNSEDFEVRPLITLTEFSCLKKDWEIKLIKNRLRWNVLLRCPDLSINIKLSNETLNRGHAKWQVKYAISPAILKKKSWFGMHDFTYCSQ